MRWIEGEPGNTNVNFEIKKNVRGERVNDP